MLNDLRYAMRLHTRSAGFTAIAGITLALGIGGSSAVFSLFRAVFLTPLPFPDADRLVTVVERRGTSRDADIPVSGHEYMAWRDSAVFEQVALYRPERLNMTGVGEPELIGVVRASSELFWVLGLRAALGREFQREEDRAGGARVAILSDGFWRRRFGADTTAVGQAITLDDQAFTIVGVMPPLPKSLSADAWLPLDVPAEARAVGRHNLSVVGRLQPTINVSRAQADLEAISRRIAQERPNDNAGHEVRVSPLRESLVGEYRVALLLLLSAVGFVLLIACANIANLLLTRGIGRQREMAVRTAIGATRWKLIRQLLVESTVLSVLGGGVGLLLATWIVDLLPAIVAIDIPLLDMAAIDFQVVAVTATLSLVTGLASGLASSLRSARPDVNRFLVVGLGSSDDRTGRRLRSLLVASEVAWTLMLLVGAGLMLNSFVRLRNVDPGFRTDRTIVIQSDLSPLRYPQPEQRRAFFDRALGAMRELPGVVAAGAVSHLPLGGADNWMQFRIAGRPAPAPGQTPSAQFRVATPDYFRALDIPLLKGRSFNDADARLSVPVIRWFPQQPQPAGIDRPQAPPVVLVSETAARQFWPDEDPLGKRIRVLFSPELTIVGVVGDVKHNALNAPSYPNFYLPHNQEPWPSFSLVVKSAGPPAQLAAAARERLRAIDPSLPATVRLMSDVKSATISQPRFYLLLIGVFGIVALALALVGIFGVVSFAVAQRTTEIGLRIALGAQHGEILALIVRQALPPIGLGIVAGIAGALTLTGFIKRLLFGVEPADPLTFSAVAIVLAAVALVACWIPARRAARLDPVVALKH